MSQSPLTRGRGRIPEAEIKGSAFDQGEDAITLPKGIPAKVRKIMVECIEQHGHLRQSHLPQIRRYAELRARLADAYDIIDADGLMVEGPKGDKKPHPLLASCKSIEGSLATVERMLMIAAVSRVEKLTAAERQSKGKVVTAGKRKTKAAPSAPPNTGVVASIFHN